MNAAVLSYKRGDTAPAFRAQCLDGTVPVSLAAAQSVRLIMGRRGGPVLVGQMTIEDQAANTGWVHRPWQTDDLGTVGLYRAEVEVTWADGTVQTFPGDAYVTIDVVTDLG